MLYAQVWGGATSHTWAPQSTYRPDGGTKSVYTGAGQCGDCQCDTWDEAEEAVARGWRATVHVEGLNVLQGKTAHGTRYTLCPAQREKAVACDDCGLCDGTRKAVPIIVFLNRGP